MAWQAKTQGKRPKIEAWTVLGRRGTEICNERGTEWKGVTDTV